MENSLVMLASVDEKRILDLFLDNPELRRQRILFNRFFGNPIWWVASPPNGRRNGELDIHPKCFEIWADPRLKEWGCRREVLSKLHSKWKEPSFFRIECRHRLVTTCVPLDAAQKRVGMLGMTHIRPGVLKQAPLELFHSMIRTLMLNVVRDYELRRLSESVRPRAIALSTVHTVHRIINSTLNLDELVNRLAHLTAQVLRAERCSIFLLSPGRGPRPLVEKAKAGYPARLAKLRRALKPGEGVEGRVFSTAKNVIRRNMICVPLIDEDVIGVISLAGKREGGKFDNFDQEILMTLSEEAVIAIKNAQLYEEQKKVTLGAIHSLAAILGARFAHTHKIPTDTVLKITLAVADGMKLSEEQKQAVHYATLLKDAGKISLPDQIIHKPTKLTGEEYQLMRQHPVKGAMMIQSFESLKPVAPIILYSHEHYNGSGYPHGLKGGDIPVGARILAVVNAFDALIAGRPYKVRSTVKEALAELRRHRGSQFDPHVVDVFEQVIMRAPIARLLGEIA